MRAVVTGADGQWSVATRPDPSPGPGEVLVQVRAVGLNHADLLARDGRYVPSGPGWAVPADRVGFEMAGEVVDRGPGAGSVLVGSRVMAQVGGALADLVVVDVDQILPAPPHLGWVEAAALPSGVLTAYDALTRVAGLRPGERVLVTGATSATGLMTVQVARELGAGRITGTTRRADATEAVRAAGADAVVVDDGDPWPDLPADDAAWAADERAVDVVVDLVGGSLLARALYLLARDGRVAQVGRLGGGTAHLDLELIARRRLSIVGTTFRGRGRDELRALTAAVVGSGVLGRVTPVVADVVEMVAVEDAVGLMGSAARPGKTVVRL